jgi:hypothetical protein
MARAFSLSLTQTQRDELSQVRDHHALAYVRVKAAGILKVADGHSLRQVAKNGLLKPIRRETVKAWARRYLHEGVTGLLVKPGRGRKPAFSPCACQRTSRRGGGARRGASQPAPLWAGPQ